MSRNIQCPVKLIATVFLLFMLKAVQAQKLSVAVAGLSHDHAHTIMNQYKAGLVHIVGIAEPVQSLRQRYQKAYQLPEAIFYESLDQMLGSTKPDAVLAFNAISEHLAVVEACAPKGIAVMVEKPLAANLEQAGKMEALKEKYDIEILVNYETTWYPSNHQLYKLVQQGAVGAVRKMVVHDGHQGPVEIGCSPDFLSWLTDPVKNGGGAITDFGCYGANLMTWLMNGQEPVAVSAITKTIKPAVYPRVDDDATILLEYPEATGIIEASWNWPFSIKDWEVFGVKGYLHALNGTTLKVRDQQPLKQIDIPAAPYKNNLEYLAAVLQQKAMAQNDPSSFEVNMIVMKILDAAKKSAKSGKKILL
ncbi:Gfo/Idh/MocA family protein [Niabella insulamsoli]|uniref:Gfo/Idh/MocA family protein n=1 Tax=Niabella insulamsoli TaxID=3144874 RepID=UPI0031FCFD69